MLVLELCFSVIYRYFRLRKIEPGPAHSSFSIDWDFSAMQIMLHVMFVLELWFSVVMRCPYLRRRKIEPGPAHSSFPIGWDTLLSE